MRRTLAGSLLLAVAVLAGCSRSPTPATPDQPGDPFAAPAAALAANRARWAALAPASYRYRYQNICFCLPDTIAPVWVTVRGGRVVAAERVEDGESLSGDALGRVPTIEALFDRIREAIEARAHRIDAAYDPALGYPTEVYIDRAAQVADEEQRYLAAALTAVP